MNSWYDARECPALWRKENLVKETQNVKGRRSLWYERQERDFSQGIKAELNPECGGDKDSPRGKDRQKQQQIQTCWWRGKWGLSAEQQENREGTGEPYITKWLDDLSWGLRDWTSTCGCYDSPPCFTQCAEDQRDRQGLVRYAGSLGDGLKVMRQSSLLVCISPE